MVLRKEFRYDGRMETEIKRLEGKWVEVNGNKWFLPDDGSQPLLLTGEYKSATIFNVEEPTFCEGGKIPVEIP